MSDMTTGTDRIMTVFKRVPTFASDKNAFVAWKDQLRVAVSMADKPMFAILNGQERPSSDTAGRTWDRKNSDLFSLLFLSTSGPAATTIRKFLYEADEDRDDPRLGDGQGAWQALVDKYDGNTKATRRAIHAQLVSRRMKPGEDPEIFFQDMDEIRFRLEGLGDKMHDDRYEDIILNAITSEYDFVRMKCYTERDFGLDQIRNAMCNAFNDRSSGSPIAPNVAGPGAAMHAATSGIQCHQCRRYGHYKRDCPNAQKQQQHKQKGGKSTHKKNGNRQGKWCSYHRTTSHSDSECKAQQKAGSTNGNANLANVCTLGSFIPPPAGAPTNDSASCTTVEACQQLEPRQSTPQVLSFGTSTPPEHSRLLDDTFDPIGAFAGNGGSALMAASTTTTAKSNDFLTWLVDSGSSGHYLDTNLDSGLLGRVSDYTALERPFKIVTGGNNEVEAVASVTVHGTVTDREEKMHDVSLSCFAVPGLGRHLFSVEVATKQGVVAIFDAKNPRLETESFVLPLEQLVHDKHLYTFRMSLSGNADTQFGVAMHIRADANLWHRRLGHVSTKSLDVLRKIEGSGVSFDGSSSPCDVCALSKSKQRPHPKTASYDVTMPFQLVFGDFMGPIAPVALGGYNYVSKITDQYSKFRTVYLAKSKSDALITIQTFVKSLVIPMGLRVQRLRTDKGGEYTGQAFEDYCLSTGIRHEFASTNTPQQVGVSERDGGILAAMTRCLLRDSGLPPFLWGELMFTAAYLLNRVPHSTLNMVTPYKKLYGTEADLSHLRVIGARAFVHVETHTKKMADRAWEGSLCGYSPNSTSYRIYNPAKKHVVESRNVVFIETPPHVLSPPAHKYDNSYVTENDFVRDLRHHVASLNHDTGGSSGQTMSDNKRRVFEVLEDIHDTTARAQDCARPTPPRPANTSRRISTRANPQGRNEGNPGTRVGTAQARELKRLETSFNFYAKTNIRDIAHDENVFFTEYAYSVTNTQLRSHSEGEKVVIVPNTFEEAMRLPEAQQWKAASDKEMNSLRTNNVFTLVPISAVPAGMKAVGSRWVYKVKADNTFKGRLVVQGWGQVPGIDCGSTFAPVCRLQSIRMVLAAAVEMDWEIWQLDVQTAFLNAPVQEEVYVKMAPGYEKIDPKTGAPLVMKLQKSLYGLRQSPLNWWNTVDTFLGQIGLVPLSSDPCVYVLTDNDKEDEHEGPNTNNYILEKRKVIAILTLYVDDVLLLGGDERVLTTLKGKLMRRFKMTDMGNASLVLGMKITRDRENGTLTISQENYTKSILEKFGMTNCNPLNTPGVGSELSLNQPEEKMLDQAAKQRYQSITGSLMYLAQVTRYDIQYAVNQLARAMSKPSKAHMAAAKHLLRYLSGTVNFGITYRKDGFSLATFSDANWGNNPDNGKSMSSYIVMLSSAPVSYKVGLQSLTAQSTMEAELVAAALAMKEAIFCCNMLMELGFGKTFKSTPVYIDNTSTLHVAGNSTYSGRTKHVALRFFFIRELIKKGRISLHYVPTASNIADIGTKHLPKHRHLQLLNAIKTFRAQNYVQTGT